MIVVLDTNIVISALLSPDGNSARIIQRWEAHQFEIATSQALVQEIERTLNYERVRKLLSYSETELESFLNNFRSSTAFVEPQVTLDIVKKDPDDNRVLECAVAARSIYIISGDAHLLDLKELEGITILPPAAFLAMLDLEG